MGNKMIFAMQAEVCKALSHPLRIEVIDLLQKKERCFTEILEITGGLKSNLSQHLSIMTQKGILKVRKEGVNNFFSLSSPKVSKACEMMREVLILHLKQQQNILETI